MGIKNTFSNFSLSLWVSLGLQKYYTRPCQHPVNSLFIASSPSHPTTFIVVSVILGPHTCGPTFVQKTQIRKGFCHISTVWMIGRWKLWGRLGGVFEFCVLRWWQGFAFVYPRWLVVAAKPYSQLNLLS